MLPAAWAAWKGAGIAGKALSIVLPIALVVGVFWVGRWQGHGKGYEECQQFHDAQALKQATQVIAHTAKQAELPSRVLEGFIKERDEAAQIRKALQRKLDHYERERHARTSVITQEPSHEPPITPTCENPDPLDESFVQHWDAIGRMFLEEAGSADDLPPTDRDPEGVPGVRAVTIQTPTLLRARAAEFDEHKRLRDHYHGLREFTKGVYIFQKTWADSQQAQEK